MNERKKIYDLIEKARTCKDSGDAQRFSQSALNCAHALNIIGEIEKTK